MTPTPASPAGTRPNGFRIAYSALAIVLAGLAALLWQHRDQLAAYRLRVGSTLPSASMRYAVLSGTMDEAALRRHFAGLPLRCGSDAVASAGAAAPAAASASASIAPGDTVCQANVAAVDGVSALALTAFLQRGRLQSLVVHTPWWAHHASVRQLTQTLGAPAFIDQATNGDGVAGAADVASAGSIVWRLHGGSVRQNRDPGWDPLAWNSVTWSAALP